MIVLTFFASIFFKKNLSTVKFLISIILLAAFNVTALALLDKYFWLKAFVLTIVDAIWLKISYIDTIIQSIGIAIGFYSFISVWDVLVLLAISFLSKREFSTYMENPVEYYLICYGVDGIDLTYLFMICEQTFNIRFTEQDSNNYGLLTPKNWIDVIESHL